MDTCFQNASGLPAQAWVFDGRAVARLVNPATLSAGVHTLNPLGVSGTYSLASTITLATGALLSVNDNPFASSAVDLSGSLTMADKSWLQAGPVVHSGCEGASVITGLADAPYVAKGTVTQAGAVAVAGNAYLSSSAGTMLTIAGAISGTGALNIARSPGAPISGSHGYIKFSRIRLESTGNTYSGGTVIRQTGSSWFGSSADCNQVWAASLGTGNVTLGGTAWGPGAFLTALGPNITASTAIINFGSAGSSVYFSGFELAGFSQSVGGLVTMAANAGTPNCQITSATGTPALAINAASGQSYTYGGKISNAIAVIKNGAGTQMLSGASTYTGGTTINAGTLTLGHAQALGTGTVVVNAGATLNRGGFAITNTITNNGGTVI